MQSSERSPLLRATASGLTSAQMLGMAKGFSCIFWGVPLSLLLACGVLNIRLALRVTVPAYVGGILLIYWGILQLRRTRPLTNRWQGLANLALLAVFLEVYFAPFVTWWIRMPDTPWYAANMLGLFGCTVWLLMLLNRLAGEAARAFCDTTFYIEAQLCAWSAIIFVVIPATVLILFSIHSAERYETTVYLQMWTIHQRLHYWIYVLFLLPFTLTMACAWKAKEMGLRALAAAADGTEILSVARKEE